MSLTTGCIDVVKAAIAGNVKPITGNWEILAQSEVTTFVQQLFAIYTREAMIWAKRERSDLFDACVDAFGAIEDGFYNHNRPAIRKAIIQAEVAKKALLSAYRKRKAK